jgi:hypothetical protein
VRPNTWEGTYERVQAPPWQEGQVSLLPSIAAVPGLIFRKLTSPRPILCLRGCTHNSRAAAAGAGAVAGRARGCRAGDVRGARGLQEAAGGDAAAGAGGRADGRES